MRLTITWTYPMWVWVYNRCVMWVFFLSLLFELIHYGFQNPLKKRRIKKKPQIIRLVFIKLIKVSKYNGTQSSKQWWTWNLVVEWCRSRQWHKRLCKLLGWVGLDQFRLGFFEAYSPNKVHLTLWLYWGHNDQNPMRDNNAMQYVHPYQKRHHVTSFT